MIPHPQPRSMHHHQNGRLVVSGEERVVDNSWLIISFPFFSQRVFCHFTCTRYVCGPHSTNPTSEISLFSCCRFAQSMPPELSLFLPPFYRRLYSSSGLFLPFCLPPLPLPFRRVGITYSPLFHVGHLQVASTLLLSLLFISLVLYNHRITSVHIHLTDSLHSYLFPFFS